MSEELRKRVGDNVRALREQRGLTGNYVAEKLDVDDRYVRRIEAGGFNLGLDSLEKIAGVFGVDAAVLLRPRRRPLPKNPVGRPARVRRG